MIQTKGGIFPATFVIGLFIPIKNSKSTYWFIVESNLINVNCVLAPSVTFLVIDNM